jgi:ribosomal protein S18 acetylase RimI-like enzyme
MEIIMIRKARKEDMSTLLRFEQGVIAAERPFDITLKESDICYYDLDMMIEAAHIHLVVAELNGQLIGSGYARIEEVKPYLQHKQHAYLGFMYVEPAHRGKGVNKLIIDELKRWTKEKGLTELRLEVYHGNTPAISAYEKVGFKKHMIEMRSGLIS